LAITVHPQLDVDAKDIKKDLMLLIHWSVHGLVIILTVLRQPFPEIQPGRALTVVRTHLSN